MTALLYSLPGCKFAQNGPQDLHNSYIFTKKYGRHVMAAAPSMVMDVPIIERLPLRWQEHEPRLLAEALGAERPIPVPPQ